MKDRGIIMDTEKKGINFYFPSGAEEKASKFWREFILREYEKSDQDDIIDSISEADLQDMRIYVEYIMDAVSAVIVSQQKVAKDEISSGEEERKIRESVFQNVFSFSTYVSILLSYVWEKREIADKKFVKAVTVWLARQTQLLVQSVRSIGRFLNVSNVQYSNSSSRNGPVMNITLILRATDENKNNRTRKNR